MVIQPIGRATRGNIYDPNLPALAEGEVAVWTQSGQLVRSRQSANGFLLNPFDGDGRIRVENGFLQVFADSTIVIGALGYTRIQAGDPALSEIDPSVIVSPDTGVEVRVLAGGVQNFTVYADDAERLRITESQGIRLFGPGATGAERAVGISTAAEYLQLFQDLGLTDVTSSWPSGIAGISNSPPGTILIGDATWTGTFIQADGLRSFLVTHGGFNRFEASFSETRMGDDASNTRLFGAAHAFYGGTARARANIVAARAALPASMGAAYSQTEANQVRNLLAALADALGNSSGVSLVQTV